MFSSDKFSVIVCAMFLGDVLKALAQAIATFVARSPFFLSAGTSIIKSGVGISASFPSFFALSIESKIAVFKVSMDF